VLDGLANLKKVDLANNKISSIGLHVFTQKANLTSLRDINLAFNSLTTLEPWPLIRGQLVSGSTVNLQEKSHQRVHKSTWLELPMWNEAACRDVFELNSEHDAAPADLTNGWNISGKHCRVHSLYNYYEVFANRPSLSMCG
jgi:hypothetical protein